MKFKFHPIMLIVGLLAVVNLTLVVAMIDAINTTSYKPASSVPAAAPDTIVHTIVVPKVAPGDEHRVSVYHGPSSNLLVRVEVFGFCSGAPIAGSMDTVITAAHCVLDKEGVAQTNGLVYDHNGDRVDVLSIDVDPSYITKRQSVDVAVLHLERPLSGEGVVVDPSNTSINGELRALGLQAADGDELLRDGGTSYAKKQVAATGNNVVVVPSEPATCELSSDEISYEDGWFKVWCGFIPGASGGPMIRVVNGEYHLVAVLSTVNAAHTENGYAPLNAVWHVLNLEPGVETVNTHYVVPAMTTHTLG